MADGCTHTFHGWWISFSTGNPTLMCAGCDRPLGPAAPEDVAAYHHARRAAAQVRVMRGAPRE